MLILVFCLLLSNQSLALGYPEGSTLVEGKPYLIRSVRQPTGFVDTNGGYLNGHQVYIQPMSTDTIYNPTLGSNQIIYPLKKLWHIRNVSNVSTKDIAIFTSYAPNKALNVPDVGGAPYNIKLLDYSGQPSQKWVYAYDSNIGAYTMRVDRQYGGEYKYMDLYDGTRNNSPLEAYHYSSTNTGLKWTFYPAYTLNESVITYNTAYDDGSFDNSYVGQCTWYCRGRAMEKLGVSADIPGDAMYWYNNATNFSRGSTIRANSIAVFTGGPHGHVIFVEYIEGSTVYYTEANADDNDVYNAGVDGILKSAPISSFTNGSVSDNMDLVGYIYLY